ADQNRLLVEAAALMDLSPDFLDRLATDNQRIQADDGDAVLSIVPNRGPHLARIVQRTVKRLAITARLLHADFGRNVALGKADLERGSFGLLGSGRDRGKRHGE